MLEILFKDMTVDRFIRMSIMIGLGGDIMLAFFLHHQLTQPEFFNVLIDKVAMAQGVELTEEQNVRVYNIMLFQVKCALALFLGIHAFNYFKLWQRKRIARRYTSVVAWPAVLGSLSIALTQAREMPAVGFVFLFMLCPGYLWMALGLHHFKSQIND